MTLDAVTKRDSMRAAVSSWSRVFAWWGGGSIHDEQDALLSVADNSAQAASGPEIITFSRRIFS